MMKIPFLLLLLAAVQPARAEEVYVAVAANFAGPARQIAAEFAQASGHKAIVSPGATGALFAQISNGAPYEVFLSADDQTPARLEKGGQAVAGTRFTYAIGKLVLWSASEGRVGDRGEVLRRGDFRHLAIANPRTAPYGAAAIEVMTALGVLPGLQSRLVQGENITQTYQFVATRNADVGFVALSQVFKDGRLSSGSAWRVPGSLHQPIRQDAVLLVRGQGKAAAEAFIAYLKSDKARAIIRSYGYDS